MFGFGGKVFNFLEYVDIGECIVCGCGWVYDVFLIGLMFEIFGFVCCGLVKELCVWDEEKWEKEGVWGLKKGFFNVCDLRYILRLEVIESVFLLYCMMGKEELREVVWCMFESVIKFIEMKLVYLVIVDVIVKGEI